MIKLNASIMKKIPIDGLDYSSRSASAGMEVEMPSGAKGEDVRCRLKQLYAVLEIAVDEQLSNPRQDSDQGHRKPNNGNGRRATEAQLKAVLAIAEDKNLPDGQLDDIIRDQINAESLSSLSIRQASNLIDILKGNGR